MTEGTERGERWEFGPWEKERTHRALLGLMIVGITITMADAIITASPTRIGTIVSYVYPVFFLCVFLVLLTAGPRFPGAVYTALPVLGCGGWAVLALLNDDATAATQLFFWLPLLYAATELRPAGAYLVLASALIGDVVVAIAGLPGQEAARDALFPAALLSGITFLLVRGARAQFQLADLLRHQAAVDSLTGLVNRRVLDEAAHSAIASAVGDAGTALILLDIDNFKTVNDTHGHPVGDRALTHIADVIAANTRKDSVISRIGGDELAVLLPSCANDVAVRRAEQIVVAVRETPLILDDGTRLTLTVSAGVAHAPADGEHDLPSLYAGADVGLYNAKRRGRNQVGLEDDAPD